jgi:hypothetical protein
LTPSPKFHTTLLIDAEDGVSNAVNVTGDPTITTLADDATATDKLTVLVVKYHPTAARTTIAITIIARILIRETADKSQRLLRVLCKCINAFPSGVGYTLPDSQCEKKLDVALNGRGNEHTGSLESRGYRFEYRNPISRARPIAPLLVPLMPVFHGMCKYPYYP